MKVWLQLLFFFIKKWGIAKKEQRKWYLFLEIKVYSTAQSL